MVGEIACIDRLFSGFFVCRVLVVLVNVVYYAYVKFRLDLSAIV